jgi:hypothetical protein
VVEGGIDGGKVPAVVERLEQLHAHAHQRGGAARGEVEPANEFLPPRLGGAVQVGRGCLRARRTPSLDRGFDPRRIRTELARQRLEEGNARTRGQVRETVEDLARQRDAGGLAARQRRSSAVDRAAVSPADSRRSGSGFGGTG